MPAVLKINLANGTLIQCFSRRTVIMQASLSGGLNCIDSGYPTLSLVSPCPRGGRRVPTGSRSGRTLPGVELACRGAATAAVVRDAGRAAGDRMAGVAGVARAGDRGGGPRVRDAARSESARRDRGRRLRVLPDSVDRDQCDLGLPNDRRDRAFRRAAALVRTGQR